MHIGAGMNNHEQTYASAEEAEQHLFELIKHFDTAMLATRTPDDSLHARPMSIAEVNKGAELWFATGKHTQKIDELLRDDRVLIIMQGGNRFLSISGRGALVNDRAKIEKLWREPWRLWFNGKDDPDLALMRVRVEQAEYWDNAGFRGLSFMARAATAYVKGEKLSDEGQNDVSTHAKVAL